MNIGLPREQQGGTDGITSLASRCGGVVRRALCGGVPSTWPGSCPRDRVPRGPGRARLLSAAHPHRHPGRTAPAAHRHRCTVSAAMQVAVLVHVAARGSEKHGTNGLAAKRGRGQGGEVGSGRALHGSGAAASGARGNAHQLPAARVDLRERNDACQVVPLTMGSCTWSSTRTASGYTEGRASSRAAVHRGLISGLASSRSGRCLHTLRLPGAPKAEGSAHKSCVWQRCGGGVGVARSWRVSAQG